MVEPLPDTIELRGDGLILRPYRDGDADALAEAVGESVAAVGRWLPWCRAGYTHADAVEWIAHCTRGWREGEHYAFAAFDAGTAGFCGSAGLNQRNRAHNFMNLGYWVRASRQGRGIGRSAARLVADFGLAQLALTRVEIVTALDNRASQRVAEALGAEFEGVGRNRIVAAGRPMDARVYALTPRRASQPAAG